MNVTDRQLEQLARLVGATVDAEIDCAELLQRIAVYLRALESRTELDARLRQVAQHLKVCPECHEEFLGLIRAEGLDPRKILGEQPPDSE